MQRRRWPGNEKYANSSSLLFRSNLRSKKCISPSSRQPPWSLSASTPSLIARVRWSWPFCHEEEAVKACKIGPFVRDVVVVVDTMHLSSRRYPEKKQRPEFGRPKTGSFYRNLRKVKGVWRVFFDVCVLTAGLAKVARLATESEKLRSGQWLLGTCPWQWPLLAGLVWGRSVNGTNFW